MNYNKTSLAEYRRDLTASLANKRLLYLDLNYWNDLCDAALDATGDAEKHALLADLRRQVCNGDVLCPIEYTTFIELYKQRIPEKRRETAMLIDELSAAVVILSPLERCFIETLRFVQAILAGQPFPLAPRDEVWTKVAFLLGHIEPRAMAATSVDFTEINRQFTAHLWNIGFVEFLDICGDKKIISFDWTKHRAEQLNSEKIAALKEFASFRNVYLAEVRGVLDASVQSLGDVFIYMFNQSGGDSDAVSDEQRQSSGEKLAQLLAAGFEKQDLSQQLPSIHVPATLYASVQWDAQRKYKPNDFMDFSHASAALGYCNAFATEGPLAALLRQSKLAKAYPTRILSSVEELRSWLALPSSSNEEEKDPE